MQTKLTLRLDEKLIRRAKNYAHRNGKSVSELVAELFLRLDASDSPSQRELTPVVRRLAGSLAGSSVNTADYRKHLEDKFR
jgi:hypothetical protein